MRVAINTRITAVLYISCFITFFSVFTLSPTAQNSQSQTLLFTAFCSRYVNRERKREITKLKRRRCSVQNVVRLVVAAVDIGVFDIASAICGVSATHLLQLSIRLPRPRSLLVMLTDTDKKYFRYRYFCRPALTWSDLRKNRSGQNKLIFLTRLYTTISNGIIRRNGFCLLTSKDFFDRSLDFIKFHSFEQ